jgi:CDP-3, 6-dideoxy-D-glycero-L-glycero-4-hexulose-4-reductase
MPAEGREHSGHAYIVGADYETAPRVAISGVTGYVGRELARLLAAGGSKILGLTRQSPSALVNLLPTVTLHRIDDRTESLCELFEGFRPDVVIHLAALARRNHLVTDVTSFFKANVLFGSRLLEAMRLCGCHKFITAESILQFSDTGESRAMNLYAATKQAFAEVLDYYTNAFGISAVALVLPTLYSEHETRSKLMTDIASAVLNGTPVDLQASSVKVDFVHVEDVASAVVRSSEILKDRTPESGTFSRYWVSSGRNVTAQELVTLFEHLGERKVDVRWQRSQINSRRMSPWCGPVLPGWTLRIDLETGIKRMLSKPR